MPSLTIYNLFIFDQIADDEANKIVKEFLQILATLQQRAKEKDPINAKKKERFVMGIKQVHSPAFILPPYFLLHTLT
jgi:hypothetical protein